MGLVLSQVEKLDEGQKGDVVFGARAHFPKSSFQNKPSMNVKCADKKSVEVKKINPSIG